jgi:DNA repair exonuclease SbcCD ATPase subunit/DNA repair exonuclease SbcCD nuclease subunit
MSSLSLLPQFRLADTLPWNRDNPIQYIIHLSDIHIRPVERHNEYRSVFHQLYTQIRNLGQDILHQAVICITGDILHNKLYLSTELVQLTDEFFRQLDSICPTLCILGNHDLNLQNPGRPHALTLLFQQNQYKQTYLLEKSGVYLIGGCAFSLASVLDPRLCKAELIPDHWNDITIHKKIALYHGGVGSYSLDNGITCRTNVPLQIFDGYDAVLLGDIHLRQFLDADKKRIAYAGSLIQQNRMETFSKHGFLLWNLRDFQHQWFNVKNKMGGILNIFCRKKLILFHPRTQYLGSAEKIQVINGQWIQESDAELSQDKDGDGDGDENGDERERGDGDSEEREGEKEGKTPGFPTNPPAEQKTEFWNLFAWDELADRNQSAIHIHLPPQCENITEWNRILSRFFYRNYQIHPDKIFVVKYYHDSLLQSQLNTTDNENRNGDENGDGDELLNQEDLNAQGETHETGENELEEAVEETWTIAAIENPNIFQEFIRKSYPNNFSLPGGTNWTPENLQKITEQYTQTIQWLQHNPDAQDIYHSIQNNLAQTNGGAPLTPLELRWDNLFCYDSGNMIDFRSIKQYPVFNISGRNFSGKSSVIDILLFALYGKSSRGGAKNILGNQMKKGRAELIFVFGQHTYRIQRGITVGRKKNAEQSLTLERAILGNEDAAGAEGAEWENITDEGVQKTQKYIEDMIGPMKIYTDGPIFLQGEADEFFQLTPSERKNLLLKKLNFDVVDGIHEHLKQKHSERNQQFRTNQTIHTKAKRIGENILNQFPRETQHINPQEFTSNLWQSIPQLLETQRDSLTLQKKQYQDIQKQYNDSHSIIEKLGFTHEPKRPPGTLEDCQLLIEELEVEMENAQHNTLYREKAIKYLEKKLPALQDLSVQLTDQDSQTLSQLIELRVEFQTLAGIPNKSNDTWNHKKELAQKELDENAPQLTEIQEELKEVKALLDEIGEDAVRVEQQRIMDYNQNKKQKAFLQRRLDEMNKFVENFQQKQGVPHQECTFCSKNPSVLEYNRIRQEEIPSKIHELGELDAWIGRTRQERRKDCWTLLGKKQQLETELGELHDITTEPLRILENAQKGLRKNKCLTQIQVLSEQQKGIQKKLFELNNWLKKPKERELPEWILLKDTVGNLAQWMPFLLQQERSVEEVRRDLEDAQTKLIYHQNYQEEYQQYMSQMKDHSANIIQLNQEKQRLEKSIQTESLFVRELESWVEHYGHLTPEMMNQLEEELQFSNAITQIFSRHGFPFYLMKRIIQQIIGVMNNELSMLTDFHIRAEFDETERKADKSDIHFYIQKHHMPDVLYDLNQGSGFERFISAILWRIHTARMYHPARIMPMDYIIFDESFHYWDQNQIGALVQLFQHLRRYAGHILVISHIQQIAELANGGTMVVRPKNGLSHLSIPLPNLQPQQIENNPENNKDRDTTSEYTEVDTEVELERKRNIPSSSKQTKPKTRTSTTKKQSSQNAVASSSIPKTKTPKQELQEQATALGIPIKKQKENGKWVELNKDELAFAIRSQLHQNFFS